MNVIHLEKVFCARRLSCGCCPFPHRCWAHFLQQQHNFLPWAISHWGETPGGQCREINFSQELLHPSEWSSTGRTPSLPSIPDQTLVDYSLPAPLTHTLWEEGMVRDGKRLKNPFQKPHLAHPSLVLSFILRD